MIFCQMKSFPHPPLFTGIHTLGILLVVKQTPFKQKPRKPLKRTPLRRTSTLGNTPKCSQEKRKVKKGTPPWIRAIPLSAAHGSGHLQKRLWRLTSDFVRIRDFYKYGRCVATGKPILNWMDGQAGHFKAYSKCNGIYKFDVRNIHLQSAQSNSWGDFEDWKAYEKELARRKVDIQGFIEDNNANHGQKLTDTEVIYYMHFLLEELKLLPEQPEYYQRVIRLMEE